LVVIALFRQLLHQVVAEAVVHQVPEEGKRFAKDLVEQSMVAHFPSLQDVFLQQTASTLVFGEGA